MFRFFIFIFECHCSSEQISCTIKFTGILLKKIHKPTKHVNINTVTPTNHHFYSWVNNKNWKLLFYRRDHLKLKVNVHLLLKKVKSKIVQVQDSYGWWKCKKCKKKLNFQNLIQVIHHLWKHSYQHTNKYKMGICTVKLSPIMAYQIISNKIQKSFGHSHVHFNHIIFPMSNPNIDWYFIQIYNL